MMTIIDILIYVFFAFFSSSLARKSENYIEENDLSPLKWDKYLVWFVVFFAVIGALRWNVGSDSISYSVMFSRVKPDFSESKEMIWKIFVDTFQQMGLHWSLGMGICALVQILFITLALKPYRWLLVFVPFALFGGRYWLDCMGAIRQMIVACGFLWACRFISEKKLFAYILFILIGSMIHQSALLLVPFYFFIDRLRLTDKRTVLIAVLLGCVIAGQTPAFKGLAGYAEMIAGATNYDDKAEEISELLTSGQTDEALSFGLMMMSYLLIPIFIIWFGRDLEEKYGDQIPCFNIWFNMAYIYACGYFLVCNISHYFIRPVMYFSLFQMVMAAMTLRYLWLEYKRYGLKQVAALAFCCVIAVNTVWDVYKSSGKPFESTTYKLFFFHKDQRAWFRL